MALNDHYCYKRIYINKGTRTSFQYHEEKVETNYIISGTAEIWLENDEGVIEKNIMKEGEYFTVMPPRKHRVIALSDIVLQEVSTPQVDDVIRIQDDIGREDGKVEYEHRGNAACILMAGTGSRMHNFSKHTNKGLLPVDNKAIVSHMIEKMPLDYDIVIALGYKKELVREYCEAAHPDRNFIFVDVGEYEGAQSGPSYSIDKCREHLQRPFYLITADTLIDDPLPPLSHNWLGVSQTGIPELYSTVELKDGNVVNFKNKSTEGFDHAFIGLAGIYDFETFWKELDVPGREVVSAFYNVEEYKNFRGEEFKWYDLGTVDNYLKAKDKFEGEMKFGITKTNGEFLYKLQDRLVKIFPDKAATQGRIEREKYLAAHTPQMLYKGDNVYSYEFVKGRTLYEVNDLATFKNFLTFAQENLWPPSEYDQKQMMGLCRTFYRDKTLERLKLFLENRDVGFLSSHIVNGHPTRKITDIIHDCEWHTLYDGIPTTAFHGDLQFDNILYSEEEGYCLIDWRHNFGGSTEVGDVYYDLAKLYGGALISYSLIKDKENFSVNIDDDTVVFAYKQSPTLKKFKKFYEKWIIGHGYSLEKVKKLTALIFLNMAPLHEKELGNMLFFMSKQLLEE